MDLGIRDRVAIVCGSSKGLGKAIALSLAQQGAHIALCARDSDVLEKTAHEIREKTGCKAWAKATDLSKPENGRNFVKEAANQLGGVDIVIANSGGPPTTTFEASTEKDWQSAFDLNFMSTFSVAHEAVPYMKKKGWGRIVLVTSVAVKQPLDGLILSNGIRSGIVGLAKSMSRELASSGILVNTVCPGYTWTERVSSLAKNLSESQGKTEEDIVKTWEEQIPMGRLGKPEELADVVSFLASERASYLTGTTIQVDGGFYRGLM